MKPDVNAKPYVPSPPSTDTREECRHHVARVQCTRGCA